VFTTPFKSSLFLRTLVAASLTVLFATGAAAKSITVPTVPASACSKSITYLTTQYKNNADVRAALGAVADGMQDAPVAYPDGNPWQASKTSDELLAQMVTTFTKWCEFLPEINGVQDNGLYYIQVFSWFYYQNPAGQAFVQGRNPLDPSKPLEVGRKFTKDFTNERGQYMWSAASKKHVAQWVEDPRIEITNYTKTTAAEFTSFNDFFSRDIIVDEASQTIPSRPATMPDLDYIVVSPTDCIMNPLVQVLKAGGTEQRQIINNPLQHNTVLDVKGIPISMDKLLGSAPATLKKHFDGGTGLSCVLMPNTYHHYHAPVNGTVKHAEVVKNNTYGYLDFPNFVPTSGNVGRPGTDFSQFEVFQRGVVIIEVTYADVNGKSKTGYVASIPVGLDTIGSVALDEGIVPGAELKRGFTRLGSFYYGGSLNILLFSKGLASAAVQTRLGNQINVLNIGVEPANP